MPYADTVSVNVKKIKASFVSESLLGTVSPKN
jgi:hypothetical protein